MKKIFNIQVKIILVDPMRKQIVITLKHAVSAQPQFIYFQDNAFHRAMCTKVLL